MTGAPAVDHRPQLTWHCRRRILLPELVFCILQYPKIPSIYPPESLPDILSGFAKVCQGSLTLPRHWLEILASSDLSPASPLPNPPAIIARHYGVWRDSHRRNERTESNQASRHGALWGAVWLTAPENNTPRRLARWQRKYPAARH